MAFTMLCIRAVYTKWLIRFPVHAVGGGLNRSVARNLAYCLSRLGKWPGLARLAPRIAVFIKDRAETEKV